MKLNFNEEKKQQLGFMHLTLDVKIFSRNESILYYSRLLTTMVDSKFNNVEKKMMASILEFLVSK
jgi:hypothetical protein